MDSKMKNNFLAAMLGLACFSALAADNVELKVTGTLVNGSCTPSLDGGGVVNFGHIPLGNLSKTAVNQLGTRNINLTITCDNATVMGWTTVDNKIDSRQSLAIANGGMNGLVLGSPSNMYGLGKTAGNVNLGAFALWVHSDQVTTDGQLSDPIYAQYIANQNGNVTWTKSANGTSQPSIRTFTAAATGTLTPKAGKVFVYPLTVSAAIQGTDALAITDDTNLDGSTTISLVYL